MKLTVWKTIKLGSFNTAEELIEALEKKGNKISDCAIDSLNQKSFTLSSEESEVELVIASVAELGFKQGAKYSEICSRIKELGHLCPAEVGPQLRLQYTDQPNNEWLRIAMEPITDSDGFRSFFDVDCDDDARWLRRSYGLSDNFWVGYNRFVFLLRK